MKKTSRRTFINTTMAAAAGSFFMPVREIPAALEISPPEWPAHADRYQFYMIGHGHIDPVWLWPWNEGIAIVHSTFRSVLDQMKETPELTFVASSAQFYQWVAENDPDMLREIRQRVEEGRWNVVGGWWVEPDVNMPNGEALARQGLYGQLTFERLLGRRAKIGFNPDSFGHPGTLPQILKLQGLEGYVFMRPGPHEKHLPADLFWWEGTDGSKVLTYRIPVSYNESSSVRERVKQVMERFRGQPLTRFMAFYGVGDHGGGPTKTNIQSIKALQEEVGAPKVVFGTLNRYFEEIRSASTRKFPVVRDELQHHAVGCYTAEAEIKKGNRKSESALITAEKIAAIGAVTWGANYPKEALATAWERVLFLQFHDSLAGTSIPEHSEKARDGYGYALEMANNAAYLAIQKLEWQIPAEDPESQYMVVFNPHAWETNSLVNYSFPWNPEQHSSRVEDEQGIPLSHQWETGSTQTGSRHKNLVVKVNIPPMGYRQLRLRKGKPFEPVPEMKVEAHLMENEFLQVRFSNSGTLGITDKETGEEVFSPGDMGCKAVILEDPSDTWSHGVKAFSGDSGAFGDAVVKMIEHGPVRTTVRTISVYNNSTLSIDWTLAAGKKALEANVVIDWHEKHKMLKFSFPVHVDAPNAIYEIPYGFIERATNGDEDPGQRWIDVSGMQNGSHYGLTLINDAKYGYSVSGNDMRVSVIRAAVYAHHDPWKLEKNGDYSWMDQGRHQFNMRLIPHKGSWKETNIARAAEEFMVPPISIYQGIHVGNRPRAGSFLAVDKSNIIVSAIKQAENSNDLIIRCVESCGEPTHATLDINFANTSWKGQFRPCEIKSLRLAVNTGKITEVNLLEEQI